MKYVIFLFCACSFLSCSVSKNSNPANEIDTIKLTKLKLIPFEIVTNDAILGSVHRFDSFPSSYIIPRTVDVWFPENYTSTKTYSVLYMNDGQDLFDPLVDKRKPEMQVDETISRLVAEGAIKDAIVVGIYNIASQRSENYLPQKPIDLLPEKTRDSLLKIVKAFNKNFEINSDDYLRFITKELKPYIDQEYATAADFKNTYIAGASMGGLISMYAVCEYPEIFGGAIGMSTHWVGAVPSSGNPLPEVFFNYMRTNLPPPEHHKFYFDFGTKGLDMFYTQYESQVNTVFQERNYPDSLLKNLKFVGGNHNVESWQPRLPDALIMMLGR
ncbi:MAG: enterochelin esterase-like enzyme [Patiriisocius sp.]|jgi:enterochelin esterase-like enzyme